MRILFVASSAPQFDGDATAPFILHMAEDLQTLGHEVAILMPHAPGIAREEVLGGVRVIRFRYEWPEWAQRLTVGGSPITRLRARPWLLWQVHSLVWGQALALWRLLRREQFDVIHAHWLLPQGLLAGLFGRWYKVPVVTMIHGGDVYGLQHSLLRRCKRWALNCTKTAIANSRSTATQVRALHADVPMEIIPVGASGTDIRPKPREEPSGRLLFVGRLFEGKGVRFLIEALTMLPDCSLKIIGGGPDMQALMTQVDTLGLSDRVTFTGPLPHESVMEALHEADVFVAPSIRTKDWTEAQGNAIIEAMLAGLPVVASDVGGISDAVMHQKTGLLVEEQNPQALAEAIRWLMDDAALATQLAEAGREHALAHFTREQTARRLEKLYQSVLN